MHCECVKVGGGGGGSGEGGGVGEGNGGGSGDGDGGGGEAGLPDADGTEALGAQGIVVLSPVGSEPGVTAVTVMWRSCGGGKGENRGGDG